MSVDIYGRRIIQLQRPFQDEYGKFAMETNIDQVASAGVRLYGRLRKATDNSWAWTEYFKDTKWDMAVSIQSSSATSCTLELGVVADNSRYISAIGNYVIAGNEFRRGGGTGGDRLWTCTCDATSAIREFFILFIWLS